jgi:hypothetical protein
MFADEEERFNAYSQFPDPDMFLAAILGAIITCKRLQLRLCCQGPLRHPGKSLVELGRAW